MANGVEGRMETIAWLHILAYMHTYSLIELDCSLSIACQHPMTNNVLSARNRMKTWKRNGQRSIGRSVDRELENNRLNWPTEMINRPWLNPNKQNRIKQNLLMHRDHPLSQWEVMLMGTSCPTKSCHINIVFNVEPTT